MAGGKKSSKGKRGRNAPPSRSAVSRKRDWKQEHKHLFSANKRSFSVGGDIRPSGRDLGRFVKWPRYVRIQRQRAILKKRLKLPPTLNHFTKALEKNQAATLFRLLAKYRPESPQEKKQRLLAQAGQEVKGQGRDESKKPKFVKYGINHITQLVESRKAKLVVIAHDVDPIEIVVWLPALCRRMDVPYVIVKGKARLGHLVHKKTATAVALTDVRKQDLGDLEMFVKNTRPMYNDLSAAERRKWSDKEMGIKRQHVARREEATRKRELAKVNQFQ